MTMQSILFAYQKWTFNGPHRLPINQPNLQAKMSTLNSTKVTISIYQPGGTCISVMGKWASCIKTTRCNQSGMGHWSYHKFQGKDDQRIIIATGYQLCNQQTQLGSSTYHDQQYCILLQQGNPQPNPWQQSLDEITEQIKLWWAQKKVVVLICMDANENVIKPNPTTGIRQLIANTDLINLHYYL